VQYAVAEEKTVTTIPLTYTFRIQLRYGAPSSQEVNTMQKALQTLKGTDGKPYMTPGVYGPYGPQTRTALGRFQADRGIADPDGPGMNFGPQTRAAMNDALKAIN
jgi:peptidoglycan hydrolase-like protein with peptidoglycan-binding domain